MSPRKKSKPNPKAAADHSSPSNDAPRSEANTSNSASNTPIGLPDQTAALQSKPSSQETPESVDPEGVLATPASEQTLGKKPSRKWLGGGGSWRSKAPAIVKTAKESIGVARGSTSELPGEEDKQAKEKSPKKFLSKRKSSKGDALPASMTKLNVSSNGLVNENQQPQREASKESAEPDQPNIDEPPLPPEPPKKSTAPEATSKFGWRSWWSRPDDYADVSKTKDGAAPNTGEAERTPLPGATPSEEPDAKSKELGNTGSIVEPQNKQEPDSKSVPEVPTTQTAPAQDAEMKDAPPTTGSEVKKTAPNNSWFWIWSTTQNAQANPPPSTEAAALKPDTGTETGTQSEQPALPEAVVEMPPAPESTTTASKEPTKPSGWAFWFRDKPKSESEDKPTEGAPHKQVGEVAVFNTPSQSHPEAAQFNEEEDTTKKDVIKSPTKEPQKPVVEEPASKRSFRSLRGRTKAKETSRSKPTESPAPSETASPLKAISPPQTPTVPDTTKKPQPAQKQATNSKQEPPNLILPEFKNTYRLVQKPNYWQQIRQYFLGSEPAMPHLHINPAPPRIKKAVAIGIHGYFPAPIFQRVLGQPTGTSIRFANAAKAAIEEWTQARGYSTDIEQIALEGEGFVAERVNTLWKLLLNWIEHIKGADFIMFACHSQGVPVAIMLVAKLIQFGCVNAARIGVCAMAGVNLGPFIEYKTKYFGPTAAELFEFSNPQSLVSSMYLAALDEVLRYGVRILYVGSIDDQLVSLESSTFSTLSHPYIYRAVFVDGRIHAPDFLTHLVGFAMKLRNLGLPDHGLIRELSPAVAGSLYAGEGHSRVYEDPRIYALAVQHALETTSLPVNPEKQRPSTSASFARMNIPVPGAKVDEKDIYALRVKDYENVGSGNQNPFFLPWAMRGLLEEEFVKKELGQEVEDLLNMFEDWRPTGKQLKDVKFRLEGVRSKL